MRLLVLLAFTVSIPLAAETVFKCVDESGKVTFTQYACPSHTSPSGSVEANNQQPSAEGETARMAAQRAPGIRKQSAGNWNDAPPEPARPKIQSEPRVRAWDSDRTASQPQNQQPCMKTIDMPVRSSRVNADGSRTGTAGTVKVMAPCR